MTASRPHLHFAPSSGWVNDPLGLTHHQGLYHLFFQFVPGRTTWDAACHWGHATSRDLHTWTEEPVVLAPGDGEDGVWSGNLVRGDDGGVVVFYTAVDAQDREIGWVRRAVPLDDAWRRWAKEDVVLRLPEGEPAVAFRDPFVYRDPAPDGPGWRMLMGGGLADGVPVVWMFTSPDLRSWGYAGRALEGTGAEPATMWECPVLVEVGDRLALVVSDCSPGTPLHVSYAWVRPVGDRFEAGTWERLGYGTLYAASTFVDADGRPGLVHWVRDVGGPDQGWAGATSLPHLLSREGERLVARPHPGLDTALDRALDRPLGGEPDGARTPILDRRVDGPGELVLPGVVVTTDPDRRRLTVLAGARTATMPWSGGPARVVLDGPVVEVFSSDGVLALPVDGA